MEILIKCNEKEFKEISKVLDINKIRINYNSIIRKYELIIQNRLKLIKENMNKNITENQLYCIIRRKGYNMKRRTFKRDLERLRIQKITFSDK